MRPVTIIATRHGGRYEGGLWAAFPREPWDIPQDAYGGDRIAYDWWSSNTSPVGVGDTPDEALADLERKLTEQPRTPQ
ncbi:hypothetical protein [Streptosporangium lutulentum]|uniref:Type II toxin-antitoxin system HicB family antitoxin n=1 Tax=Streptosporangium lutulentum TaxID=1461250 RepID=A0ABT9QA57_9ACTN|nr:hypothetical protein [Streptosporangium lutulentum]MDP9843275.1 hypothetical protein [Streptosporangium lutulentum]